MSPEEWRAISPHLDYGLDLTGEEREQWLADFVKREPELGARLRSLLNQSPAAFLDGKIAAGARPFSLAGQAIGGYTLLSEIGQGGMSTVWLAERNDLRFERRVAIKFLNIALTGGYSERRFIREGTILARLIHPFIAQLLDAGVAPSGQPYLILEHIDGQDIAHYSDERRLDIQTRLRLFLDVLVAVGHAHSNLIVHRDIKPSNVMVTKDGGVKLLDFGISKMLESEAEEDLTYAATSRIALTLAYAAPEQMTNQATTTATDTYSLGVLLYVLLTGQHPAGRRIPSQSELMKSIVEREPARASSVVVYPDDPAAAAANAARRASTPGKLRRQLAGDLDIIIQKTLKKHPAERYTSAAELASDLRRYLRSEPIQAKRDKLGYRVSKFVRRHRSAVALGTAAIAMVVISLVVAVVQARKAALQRELAFRQISRGEVDREFETFLLSDAAPSGKLLSVHELLARGEQIIEQQHSSDAANQVGLMIWVGEQYLLQDEAKDARRLLREARRRSLQLSDPSIRAKAACALAASLARDEELELAEALLQEGLRDLPSDSQFVFERIECLSNGSEVAEQRGDIRAAVRRAELAEETLRQSPFESTSLELGRSTDLAKMYSSAGRDEDALAAFEKSGALLSALGRDKTRTAISFFNDWALELDQVGQPLAAEPLFRRAIETGRTGQASEDISPMLLTNYARTLRELARLDEAASYAEQAYGKAIRVNHQLAINQSLLERARIYDAHRRPARAMAMLAEVEPRLRQSLPPAHYAFAALSLEKSKARWMEGDVAGALRLTDEALAIDRAAIASGGAGAFFLPTLLTYRSAFGLAAGQVDRAQNDAEKAIEEIRLNSSKGALAVNAGKAHLLLGCALIAQGKSLAGRNAIETAVKHFIATLGPGHPLTRTASQIASHPAATFEDVIEEIF